ncbi:MAG: hypothetical protein P8N51_13900 [Pseudomonadales bacterium]|nr:hypothetical protein [Pseudomonadales bacterium]MDG1442338.1 hypothetical protein [Pseudomonadales bacterium]
MFLERCLIFLIFGFFVFIADVGQWSSRSGVIMFAFEYVMWFVLIALTFRLTLRHIGSTKTSNYSSNHSSNHLTSDSTNYSANYSTNEEPGNEIDHSTGAQSLAREMT